MFRLLESTFPQLITAYLGHERASTQLGAVELWEAAWREAAYADAIDSELIVDSHTSPQGFLWAPGHGRSN